METNLEVHTMIFSIRDLAFRAKEAIVNKDDTGFASLSFDMISIANQIYPDLVKDIKNTIYETSFDLHESKSSRDNIANSFVKSIIDTCKTFMN